MHRRDVVAVVHHVVDQLRPQAVERAAAGKEAGDEAGVAGLEHAVVEMVVREERGRVVHRAAVAGLQARAVAVEVEEVPAGVPHRVERDRVAADKPVFIVGKIGDGVGDRVEVVGGVADLVEEAVMDGVAVATEMNAGARGHAKTTIDEGIALARKEDARLTRGDRVTALFHLADAVLPGEVGEVREVAAVDGAVCGVFQPHRCGDDVQPLDPDMLPAAHIESDLSLLRLDGHGGHGGGIDTGGRDEQERVVLPVPFAGPVERVDVAHQHAAAQLMIAGVLRPIHRPEPPALGAVADFHLTVARLLDRARLAAPALVMNAVVDGSLPVVGRLAGKQLARNPAGAFLPRLRRDRKLAERGPERRKIADIHAEILGGLVRMPSLDREPPADKHLVAAGAERPVHRCPPDIFVSIVQLPAADGVAAADDDFFARVGPHGDRSFGRAAAGEDDRLAVGAAADHERIARGEAVDSRLQRGQRFFGGAIGCIVAVGGDEDLGRMGRHGQRHATGAIPGSSQAEKQDRGGNAMRTVCRWLTH